MQMRRWFAYDYDFQKWEFQYYYRPEFGRHIQNLDFSIDFKLSGLNHTQGDSGGYKPTLASYILLPSIITSSGKRLQLILYWTRRQSIDQTNRLHQNLIEFVW